MQKYRKKNTDTVVAIQIKLKISDGGINYEKWGGTQWAKQDDWIVNNNGEVYTIDQESFAKTYERVSKGLYVKTATVWAEQADSDGQIKTKEGLSDYKAGDMLVYNGPDRTDGYCMGMDKFRSMYELA